MHQFNCYAVFYLNLMYSSLSVKDRNSVIEKCYWPLLELIEEGIPLGIQISGVTLEIIKRLDPAWIKRLKKYLSEQKCELVGGGYSQIIGPLVPSGVNHYNQVMGLEVYRKILNIRPKIASVNEMAYSAGLLRHYFNNGYQAIIMEWNNPRCYHTEWNSLQRYYRQKALDMNGYSLPLIWIDSIGFQKFQRYVYEELSLREYMGYLFENSKKAPNGYLCLYASDTEVFNYRPGRYHTGAMITKETEWNRVKALFDNIMKQNNLRLLLPSEIAKLPGSCFSDKKLHLESVQQPLTVKKQEKYNINRWALTGRDDLGVNTKCYSIYECLKRTNNNRPEVWKELCYLWSSDFRTHITAKRWAEYLKRLGRFYKLCKVKKSAPLKKKRKKIIKMPYTNRRFQVFEDERYLTVETGSTKCIFNKLKGAAVDKFWIKELSGKSLLGTLPHGYYDDMSFGADFYSGHTIIERPGEHKITDLLLCKPEIELNDRHLLTIKVELGLRGILFKKEYHINLKEPCFGINSEIHMPRRQLGTIRPVNITFIPTSFDRRSLFYATHNGGCEMEKFKIGKSAIHHAQNLSYLISAKHGLGATEGVVVVGDSKKHISIYHDQTVSAMIPSIHFVPMDDGQYFLRLQYSAQEMDETFREHNKKVVLKSSIRIKDAKTV